MSQAEGSEELKNELLMMSTEKKERYFKSKAGSFNLIKSYKVLQNPLSSKKPNSFLVGGFFG